VNRVDVKMSSSWWRFEGTARYYKISGDITTSGNDDEAVQLSTQLRVTDQFFVTYGRMRDISGRTNASGIQGEPRNLRDSIGVAYEDDCSRFELAYETSDSVDRTLGPTESIVFRFSLKTLGQFGSTDTD
jgi:LPS-assembly protein